jgi:chromosome segregation ATPase
MKKKDDWYDKLHTPDKELWIDADGNDQDGKAVRSPVPRKTRVDADLEEAMTMVDQLEDDLEKLHESYDEARREITKLKGMLKAKTGVVDRMQGHLTERDEEIKSLKHHIHNLKVQLSPDQVLHKRILPELKLKRHSHKPSTPDYGDL